MKAALVSLALILFSLALVVSASFEDVTTRVGVSNTQQPLPIVDDDCVFGNCIPDSMTGGAAVGDYNNDGYPDIMFTRQFERDILYRNNQDGTFTDVTTNAGLSMTGNHRSNGVLWCDFDNDNDLDLYVTTLGSDAVTPNGNRFYLYMNNGDGTFSEEGIARGVAMDDGSARYGTSATCGDYNGDGWLDLHVNQWDQAGTGITEVHTKLFRNNGNGQFVDVSGIQDFVDYGENGVREVNFSSTFVDIDKDGDQDLLVSGDFVNSQYYRNDNGRFIDITEQSMCCTEENGMGTAFGDIDKNGYLDWFITSVYGETRTTPRNGNRMYLSDGSNQMVDATDFTGTREADWGWGATFLDYDNDGDLDLVNTNGQYFNIEFFQTDFTRFWENVNGDGSDMVERAAAIGINDNDIGKSAITLDYDLDGDLDLIISNTGAGLIFYENNASQNGNGWLRIQTPGVTTNRMGVGAQITVWVNEDDLPLYQEMGVGGHYLGHSENTIAHFGLGSGNSDVFRVEVHFPVSRQTVVRENIPRNSLITIAEPAGSGTFSTDSFSSFDDSDSSTNTNGNTNTNSGSSSSSSNSGSNSSEASMLSVSLFLSFILFALF